MSKDIYEIITARFIDQLKRGTVPWHKPWMGVQNIVSKKPYRGINTLIFGGSDFQSPYWLTFKQAHDLGGNIKKGEKATPVIYYKLFEKRDASGRSQPLRFRHWVSPGLSPGASLLRPISSSWKKTRFQTAHYRESPAALSTSRQSAPHPVPIHSIWQLGEPVN